MRAPFAHTAHAPPAAAASPATARTFATAPSTRPPYGPAPPKPACATPTRVWNTTIHAMLQTLNTCTPCIAATPRRAPAPKTAQKIPSPYMERRPRLWPAPTRHTTLAQHCNALLAANATVFRLWYSLGQSLPGPRPNQPTNLRALQARAERGLAQHRSIRSPNSQQSGQRSRPLAFLTLNECEIASGEL